jgi:hypothetical protein
MDRLIWPISTRRSIPTQAKIFRSDREAGRVLPPQVSIAVDVDPYSFV